MDEQINRTMLDNFTNNCESLEIRKTFHPQGVLRGVENGSLQFMAMPNREQEFIDHTLLGPEYITNTISNSFIIDLMEQPDSSGQTSADCQITSLNTNETFASEAQLHTIFQFVNRQGQIRTHANISAESSSDHLNQTDKEILDSDFMAMHGNLLNEQNFKIFCSQPSISTPDALDQDINVSPVQSLPVPPPPLTPIRWLKKELYEEPLGEMPEIVGPVGGTAKKILPHKKRISKKLKIIDKSDSLYQINGESPTPNSRLVITNGPQFECELCGSISESQVQFFAHLKGHYEPNAVEDAKSAVDSTRSAPIVIPAPKSGIEKTSSEQSSVAGHQVFNDVELNFDTFGEVVALSTQDRHTPKNVQDPGEMKILNPSVIAKCMEYVVQDTTQAGVNEIEFSDTEDMLEGIRGVVDKVSVDDTSNDIDMPAASVSKESWFTNSAFNGLSFKEEPINSGTFERVSELVSLPSIPSRDRDETDAPVRCMPANQVDDEFNEPDNANDDSSNEHNNSQTEHFDNNGKKRKRGRPKGSTKRKRTAETKTDDASSDEIEGTKRRHVCTKCNREFNSCNALKYHDLSHTGERPHQCDVCGKSFFAQSALKSHIRVHTGDKPYECDKCHRKFRQWSDLKYHDVSIHSDEKNYQCEFCGKSFSRKYSLVIHRRIHTSERNYKCEFCPKSFRASSYLQNHRKIHTGEKPYECDQCGKKFRVSGDLRRHLKTHERNRPNVKLKKEKNSDLLVLPTKVNDDAKPNVVLKMEYQKESKDNLLFLNKMTSKIDHLFKTEEVFMGDQELSFVT